MEKELARHSNYKKNEVDKKSNLADFTENGNRGKRN
jgi:hypothetical protein